MRPGYPSALAWVDGLEQLVGCAVRCATCGETSLNMVSRRHLDEPFFHDPVVHAVERPVGEIAEIERFRAELWSRSLRRAPHRLRRLEPTRRPRRTRAASARETRTRFLPRRLAS